MLYLPEKKVEYANTPFTLSNKLLQELNSTSPNFQIKPMFPKNADDYIKSLERLGKSSKDILEFMGGHYYLELVAFIASGHPEIRNWEDERLRRAIANSVGLDLDRLEKIAGNNNSKPSNPKGEIEDRLKIMKDFLNHDLYERATLPAQGIRNK